MPTFDLLPHRIQQVGLLLNNGISPSITLGKPFSYDKPVGKMVMEIEQDHLGGQIKLIQRLEAVFEPSLPFGTSDIP